MNKEVFIFRLIIGILIALAVVSILFIYDFYKDYKCSTMPFSEMVQDHSCDKYWRKNDK